MQNAEFGEAAAPLVAAFVLARELSEYDQDVIGMIVDLLRNCYAGDPTRTAEAFRELTGQELPDWVKEPPAAFED